MTIHYSFCHFTFLPRMVKIHISRCTYYILFCEAIMWPYLTTGQRTEKNKRWRKEQGGEDRTRVRQEEKKREMADLLVLPRPAKSVQNGAGFSRKNLSILGLPKRKRWPQCHRESSWQVRRSRSFQEEKEQSRQSKAPDHEGGESQGGRELHLGEKEGD